MSRSGPARQIILCYCPSIVRWQAPIMASFTQPATQIECPDLQQLLLSQERAISVKAETHVMVLHTTRKFVKAMPTSVTHRRTDNKNLTCCHIWEQNDTSSIPAQSIVFLFSSFKIKAAMIILMIMSSKGAHIEPE